MNIRQNCESCNVLCKSLFSSLDKTDLLQLSLNKRCHFYKRGQAVFSAGSRPGGIYCIHQGKVKVFRTGEAGKEQILRFALAGEFIGLRAFLKDMHYSANAVALEDSIICFINRQDFSFILHKYPQITTRIVMILSQMLDDADQKITSLAQKPVRERLAETLVMLTRTFKPAGQTVINGYPVITLSREDLANLIGTATETVIRLLSEFKHDGLITLNGRKISILDLQRLRKIGNLI
ncbi:MAG TPA: Crp/Fnr family transcriptional regulator [Bacteroidales bacterium]|nr:Crp/Fnr family transcriptional regulator [Bacteroidales bacterium]HSA42416.1 Crp/Fnr family transcriptional regulator [Bacteroidales bacterium]